MKQWVSIPFASSSPDVQYVLQLSAPIWLTRAWSRRCAFPTWRLRVIGLALALEIRDPLPFITFFAGDRPKFANFMTNRPLADESMDENGIQRLSEAKIASNIISS